MDALVTSTARQAAASLGIAVASPTGANAA
jgi:hypothetical protein